MSDDQTSKATWVLLELGATEVDLGSGGELDSRVPTLQKTLTFESVDGDEDLVYVSYKEDGETTSSPGTSRTGGTSASSGPRLRPFILTSTMSTPNGLISTYRPVVNIASSDVVGDPRELVAQVNFHLSQLICGDASTVGPNRVAFRNALASQAGIFHVQHARTWTDLIKEATSTLDGRTGITALRSGEITIDPTEFMTNNNVPLDHVSEYYALMPQAALVQDHSGRLTLVTDCTTYNLGPPPSG